MDFNDTKEEAEYIEVETYKRKATKSEKVGGRYDAIDVQEDAIEQELASKS